MDGGRAVLRHTRSAVPARPHGIQRTPAVVRGQSSVRNGDAGQPAPPDERRHGRNHGWRHLDLADVMAMPDKWEYPWFAAWDLAFHAATFVHIDPDFAKQQLLVVLREYYMHPNGQIPAYEWNFSDVNPPVHAWGVWYVFEADKKGLSGTQFATQAKCF